MGLGSFILYYTKFLILNVRRAPDISFLFYFEISHLFSEAERDSVSVECGVDYIEVIVNRTQLTGQYDELSMVFNLLTLF